MKAIALFAAGALVLTACEDATQPIGVDPPEGPAFHVQVGGQDALSGIGSAAVDGILSPGEWDAAGQVDFLVNVGGGATSPATFFAMNDANNLYLALRVETPPPGSQVRFSSFAVEFDNDHDGVRDEGDDVFVLNPPGQLFDDFRTFLPPCPAGALCGLFDADFGGTNDGVGQVSTAGGFTIYETSRPLDSADDAHDFSLRAGDTLGWTLSLRLFVGPPGSQVIVDTSFPTVCVSCPTLFGDIVIASPLIAFAAFDIEEAEVVLDEFEVGGSFAVAAGSGIDVPNEDVTVTFDEFSETIPAGSFFRDNDDQGFQFVGVTGGITEMEIHDNGTFEVEGSGIAQLSGIDLSSPVPLSLQIGDDVGETDIQFDALGHFPAQ